MLAKESDSFYINENKNRLIEEIALYVVENNSTVRQTAKYFGISKSTIHKYLTVSLKEINFDLYVKTDYVLQKNKLERHIRGGIATKMKYLNARK